EVGREGEKGASGADRGLGDSGILGVRYGNQCFPKAALFAPNTATRQQRCSTRRDTFVSTCKGGGSTGKESRLKLPCSRSFEVSTHGWYMIMFSKLLISASLRCPAFQPAP
ncbi:unnamed protein product, partial [Ectocarpus sp. 13 AM-2016]